MRSDMFKVIVERPRKGKSSDKRAVRWRNDLDGPRQLGIRQGYGRPWLNENLNPLERYLHAQVGRPWAKVFSEVCAQIDRRNTVQQHVHQHIGDFIATDVEWRDGVLVNLKERGTWYSRGGQIRQRLYVDPKSGLVRVNKAYRTRAQYKREEQEKERERIATQRRVIDASTLLLKLDEHWFRVQVATLPERTRQSVLQAGVMQNFWYAESRFDVVLKRETSRLKQGDELARHRLYGCMSLYAVTKQQACTADLVRCGVK